ncbi:MAG: UbiD family decarboxylase [Planctomycetes bacterium]|nr:UbiD family decarboxylase [Planctomycetota bacterium]
MYRSLGDFLKALDEAGELRRIYASVSADLEITEITDRQSKLPCATLSRFAASFDPEHCNQGGHALLFENVENSDFPLAINIFGSYFRMEMALGCHESGGFERIASRIAKLTKPEPPRSLMDMLTKAKQFLPLLRIPPKRVRKGACQEVVKLTERGEVDLHRLPLIKCWPLDGDPAAVGYDFSSTQAGTDGGKGRYITFAGMHTIHADDEGVEKPASHNIGMYRAPLLDSTHLGMHWHVHHDGAAHWRSWKKKGKPMPMAICFGGESVMPYAAIAPLPPGLSELLMAGFLNGRGIRMVRAKTVPLWVPANSEIVIEGFVNTDCGLIDFDPRSGEALGEGAIFEGPFGDHTGYYSMPDRYPIMDVTAVTHRKQAVFPAIIVGLPPQEDYYLGKATERIFLPLLKTLIPDIEDYHLPRFGCFHNCAFIKVKKAYPLQARRIMHAVWGAGQMAWTKIIIVVDDDVDVHNDEAVLRAVFENCHFVRDLELVNGPLDILDHAAPRLGAGHKLGIDATRKCRGEEVGGIPIEQINGNKATVLSKNFRSETGVVDEHLPEFGLGRCLFVSIDKTQPGQGAKAIEACFNASEADFVIAVDRIVNVQDTENVLFHLCANADPGRDIIRINNRIGLDATRKIPGDERNGQPVRDYPPILKMSHEIKTRVLARWAEYGFE